MNIYVCFTPYYLCLQVIEQAWGMVVNRFRIFKAVSEIKGNGWEERFSKLILTGLILHNISIRRSGTLAYRGSFGLDAEDRREADASGGVRQWLR